ncbi:MAG: PQQ-binding-like beta-propeller repeat protein [Rubripirellula sp.]|nr:PQQ-binding-like beta-propeller repeat protein [Rubripirellula sp.]
MIGWLRFIGVAAVGLTYVLTAEAENWPGWRGPLGDGTTITPGPTDWDGESGKNIAWKAALPGEGHSCPIVWQDRLFVTSCLPDSQQRLLMSVNRANGQILWQRTVLKSRLESKHALNSYASSTPTTDGEFVYVSFFQAGDEQIVAPNVGNERLIYPGQMVVAAYDFTGNQQWLVRPGQFISAHGFCSNPVLYGDLLIINGDHDGDSYLVALDKRTGKQVWKQPRVHRTRSYSTPLIRSVDGEDQLVLCGSVCVASFDPLTGDQIWSVDGPTEQFVASVVYDGTNFFAAGGFPTHHVMAIRPGGRGNVTDTHVSWHETNVRCYVPSPVLVGNHLLVADDRGTANCFDTKTGTRLWQTRLGRHYSASLTAAAGLVYFIDDDGVTKVLRPGREPEVIAENRLGEKVSASPAFGDGQLFLRGRNHLFCIQAD